VQVPPIETFGVAAVASGGENFTGIFLAGATFAESDIETLAIEDTRFTASNSVA